MYTHLSWEALGLLICLMVLSGMAVVPTNTCMAASNTDSSVQGQGTIYYVNYENGSDSAPGTSPDFAWKHAPGDPNAEAMVIKTTLHAGDTILFKAGVVYRGMLTMRYSGANEAPITYTGEGWGDGKAILDGSEMLKGTWHSCESAEVCGNNPLWRNIYYVDLQDDISPFTPLYEGNKMLWFAQDPNQPDPFWYNNTANYYSISQYNPNIKLTRTTLRDITYFNQNDSEYWDQAYVAVWAKNNVVHISKVTGYDIDTHTITFDELAGDVYTDKTSYYSILNHIAHVDMPGEYAYDVSTHRIYLWPNNDNVVNSNMFIGKRSIAIDVNRQSHLVINGFLIQNFYGKLKDSNGGTAIYSNPGSKANSNIVIKNNDVTNIRSMGGANVINLINVNNAIIQNNNIHENQKSMGISCGGNNNIIDGNIIRKIGRTGILLNYAYNSRITNNVISEILDVHGNGISVYLDNRNILVAGNYIYNAYRPLTFQGNGNKPVDNNITIYNNIMIGKGTDAAISSWGNNTQGVNIINNILIGNNVTTGGISLNANDKNVVVINNIMDGLGGSFTWQTLKSQWVVNHNIYIKVNDKQNIYAGWSLQEGELVEKNISKIFINAKESNYRSTANSPSINAGINPMKYLPANIFTNYEFKMDIEGNERVDEDAWDIGCYETVKE